MKKLLIAAAVALGSAGFLTGCSSSDSPAPAVKAVDHSTTVTPTVLGPNYPVSPIGGTQKVWETDNSLAEYTVSNLRVENGKAVVDLDVICRQTPGACWPGQLSAMDQGGHRVQQEDNLWKPDHPDWFFRNTMAPGEHNSGKVVFDIAGPVKSIYLDGTPFAARWDVN